MKYLAQFFLCLSVVCSSFVYSADYIGSPVTTIHKLISYSQYGNGDIAFTISSKFEKCNGFWFNKSEPGYNAMLSMLIAAYQSKNNLVVYSDPDKIWTGSSAPFCHVYALEYK
ncbi:hypothetical protein [Zooshikella ganghwensis]|uniref:Uncharacterized protein n=1 Tax=Zooshikella ganghwensis TaxID=202772 RepID=A0A4P9VN95_9GAMM|nr:hypothetical protein [Zooshikella ganghwensis]RDH43412.1 hypothetical protein B9G39_08145 [Zooshikella ganghwensis]